MCYISRSLLLLPQIFTCNITFTYFHRWKSVKEQLEKIYSSQKHFSKIVRKYIITLLNISNDKQRHSNSFLGKINHRSKQNYSVEQKNITIAHMTSPNTKKKGIKTYWGAAKFMHKLNVLRLTSKYFSRFRGSKRYRIVSGKLIWRFKWIEWDWIIFFSNFIGSLGGR